MAGFSLVCLLPHLLDFAAAVFCELSLVNTSIPLAPASILCGKMTYYYGYYYSFYSWKQSENTKYRLIAITQSLFRT